ncbi:capsule biosynthesis protein CapI [Cytobacillus kochii]|uniref:oligosaccharide repeat unit polymerase n=1 Tax=Cytobacillus kochii TaxID=859143 RepID=UPI001CD7619D|nr:oligosaccharide repeat unit polymerase [Cytobacillus kochii]MCA1026258.1 capsule biosynthesis protein CapI [Cytobacillus kochii]
MYLSKKIDIFISIIVFTLSTMISVFVAYNVAHPGYRNLFLLPLIYGVVYVIFISPIRRRLNNIFIHVFIAVSFTRYVILPLLITMTKYYGGRSTIPPLSESFHSAIYLMSYELIIVSLFTFIIFKNYKKPSNRLNKVLKPPSSIFIYILFISLSFGMTTLFPQALKSFSFLKVSDDFRDFGQGPLFVTLLTYCLVIAKYLIFIIILNLLNKKFTSSGNKFYIFLSFLLVLFSISIYFGDNRADFIITAIASILLFFKLYPQVIKRSLIPFLLSILLVTSFINDQRNHASLSGGEDKLLDVTSTLQIYLGGPYNVAIAIEAAHLNEGERKLWHLGHELLRPVLGLNLILKEIDIKPSSTFFNERIFFSDHVSQIIPIIGQGYFYLGFLFSPIIMILYLLLVKYFIKIQDNHNRIDMYFFLSIPIARIGFAMGQNGSILANDISFFLLLFIIIYYINNRLKVK